jgi:hypothetical protein
MATPLFDKETMTVVNEIYQRADAFLFRRRTYEISIKASAARALPARRCASERAITPTRSDRRSLTNWVTGSLGS